LTQLLNITTVRRNTVLLRMPSIEGSSNNRHQVELIFLMGAKFIAKMIEAYLNAIKRIVHTSLMNTLAF